MKLKPPAHQARFYPDIPRLDFWCDGVWVTVAFKDDGDGCYVLPSLTPPEPVPSPPLANCEWTVQHHDLLATAYGMWRRSHPAGPPPSQQL